MTTSLLGNRGTVYFVHAETFLSQSGSLVQGILQYEESNGFAYFTDSFCSSHAE